MVSRLVKIIAGITAFAAVCIYSGTRPIEYQDKFTPPKNSEKIHNIGYPFFRQDNFGNSRGRELFVQAFLDKDVLLIENYTQDWDKKDWYGTGMEGLPPHKRQDTFDHNFSKIYVFTPPEIDVKNVEQRAFVRFEDEWDGNLKECNKHPDCVKAYESAEEIGKTIFSKEVMNIFKNIIRLYRDQRISPEGFEILPQVTQRITGITETARQYRIEFENNLEPGKSGLIKIIQQLAVKNLLKDFVHQEEVEFSFSLTGENKKEKKETPQKCKKIGGLGKYFLRGKECNNLREANFQEFKENLSFREKNSLGREKNLTKGPHIFKDSEVGIFRSQNKLPKNVVGKGKATYILSSKKQELGDFNLKISEFKNESDLFEFLYNKKVSQYEGGLIFRKKNVLVISEFPRKWDLKREHLVVKILKNYVERLDLEVHSPNIDQYLKGKGIPSSESGRLFLESIKFMEPFYGSNGNEKIREYLRSVDLQNNNQDRRNYREKRIFSFGEITDKIEKMEWSMRKR